MATAENTPTAPEFQGIPTEPASFASPGDELHFVASCVSDATSTDTEKNSTGYGYLWRKWTGCHRTVFLRFLDSLNWRWPR